MTKLKPEKPVATTRCVACDRKIEIFERRKTEDTNRTELVRCSGLAMAVGLVCCYPLIEAAGGVGYEPPGKRGMRMFVLAPGEHPFSGLAEALDLQAERDPRVRQRRHLPLGYEDEA